MNEFDKKPGVMPDGFDAITTGELESVEGGDMKPMPPPDIVKIILKILKAM